MYSCVLYKCISVNYHRICQDTFLQIVHPICLQEGNSQNDTTTSPCLIPLKVIASYGEVLLSDQIRRECIQSSSIEGGRVVGEIAV